MIDCGLQAVHVFCFACVVLAVESEFVVVDFQLQTSPSFCLFAFVLENASDLLVTDRGR